MPPLKDLTGKRFGRLLVVSLADERKNGKVAWVCHCDCGELAEVRSDDLLSGHTQSCGCLHSEVVRAYIGDKHPNFKNLTGMKFGKLLVLNPTNKRKNGCVIWACQCDCGEAVEVRSGSLLSGNVQSCGCLTSENATKRNRLHIGDKHPSFKDLTGQKFGRLLVLNLANERKNGSVIWACRCDCGATVNVRSSNLLSGGTQSCGCLNSENATKLGHSRIGDKHPNWVADRTLVSSQRNRAEMRHLSRKCFERDGFACLFCGKRGGGLQAHHLFNWWMYPERRFDLDNLVTLCGDCHKQFHHLYGRKNNTPSQFYEWVGVI